MSTTPTILTSAQTLYKTGFDRLNRAAATIVNSTLESPALPTDSATLRPQIRNTPGTPHSPDPLIAGLSESIRATIEVSAATALVHAYTSTTNTLMDLLHPKPKRPR